MGGSFLFRYHKESNRMDVVVGFRRSFETFLEDVEASHPRSVPVQVVVMTGMTYRYLLTTPVRYLHTEDGHERPSNDQATMLNGRVT
jgi:hypothetical protein